jgi:hypothetical protein
MIAAALLALSLVQAPLPSAGDMASGEWLVVGIGRVIAPNQHPGECFVEGRVERVVHGRAFRAGAPIALTLRCRAGAMTPIAAAAPEPPTIRAIRSQKHALVHVDAGGRVLANGFWGLGAYDRLRP